MKKNRIATAVQRWMVMGMREKLIELLTRYFTIGDSYCYNLTRIKTAFEVGTMSLDDFEEFDDDTVADIADFLIANGVTIQKWIPVTERLPEHDLPKGRKVKQIKVLVAYKTNSRWVTRTQIRAKGYWYGEPDWSWVKTSDPITHWMPLPEAPNGERRTDD